MRGLDRLEEGAETPNHRVMVNHLQGGEKKKRAKLSMNESGKHNAKAASNVGTVIHVAKHGFDELGHHAFRERRIYTTNELDNDTVDRRLCGLL